MSDSQYQQQFVKIEDLKSAMQISRIGDVISRIHDCRHKKNYLPAHQLHPTPEQG
jgi:hypothetical protein